MDILKSWLFSNKWRLQLPCGTACVRGWYVAKHKAVGTDLWLGGGGGKKKFAIFFLNYTFISKG